MNLSAWLRYNQQWPLFDQAADLHLHPRETNDAFVGDIDIGWLFLY